MRSAIVSRSLVCLLGVMVVLCSGVLQVEAQTAWTNAGSGVWSDADNWDSGVPNNTLITNEAEISYYDYQGRLGNRFNVSVTTRIIE